MELRTDKTPYPILCIDFETSDLPLNEGRPIEFAAGLVDPITLEPVENNAFFYCLIKLEPGEEMNPKALEVHGITVEKLEAEGITRAEACVKFLQWLQSHGFNLTTERQLQLLGQNIFFDLQFLIMLIGAHYFQLFHYKYLDTMGLADLMNRAHAWGIGFDAMPFRHPETNHPSVSLESQAYFFGLDTEGAHSAIVDIINTIKLFKLHVVTFSQELVNSRKYSEGI